jgi:uncharacterized protein YjiK
MRTVLRLLAALVLLAPLPLAGCGNGGASTAGSAVRVASDGAPPYRFAAPDARFELPGRLDEVSGLTALDDARLGAVQDEDGDLYVLDAATGEVVHTHDFGGGGDYEGVERVGDRVVVLRSDGRLFVITDRQQEKAKAESLDLDLHGGCDAEGLAFDAAGDRLLVACKEDPGRGLRGSRALYAFDLNTSRLGPAPAYVIHADSLARSDGEHAVDEAVRAFVRPLADINAFKPSALAVHPETGEIYVLSSVRKVLVVLERAGAITAVWPLADDDLPQPEGLAFLPDGTLFIASEAAGGSAVLLRFDYRPH